jgi:geranylgeranyl pyrophosphate synthase
VLAIAAERARGDDRELLGKLSRGEHVEGVSAERVRRAIGESKADEKAALLLEGYKEQAIRALDGLTEPTLKGLLRRVLGKIFDELKFEGFCREAEQERTRQEAGERPAATP